MKLIINANREGYGTDQIRSTMTVGDLIDMLAEYDSDTPVYIGNDLKSYGWYTYGGIRQEDLFADYGDSEEEEF